MFKTIKKNRSNNNNTTSDNNDNNSNNTDDNRNFVRPGPWSAFVYVLIIVLISYCHMCSNTFLTIYHVKIVKAPTVIQMCWVVRPPPSPTGNEIGSY
jgi:hypothetical protein